MSRRYARRVIVAFVDEGLGHSSYLVDLGDGRALVVDPPRLPTMHVAAARARGLEIAFTADTHSHADYVSGSPELAAQGAVFLASKGAHLEIAASSRRGGRRDRAPRRSRVAGDRDAGPHAGPSCLPAV